jgi:hypothetical protein
MYQLKDISNTEGATYLVGFRLWFGIQKISLLALESKTLGAVIVRKRTPYFLSCIRVNFGYSFRSLSNRAGLGSSDAGLGAFAPGSNKIIFCGWWFE